MCYGVRARCPWEIRQQIRVHTLVRHLALLGKLFLDFRLLQLISEDARLNNPASKLSLKTVASTISTESLAHS